MGLILFVGLIGILNIINTVYTNIHTRVTEIGMQRAIGMSAGSLYKTFLWEGAYYGIIASVDWEAFWDMFVRFSLRRPRATPSSLLQSLSCPFLKQPSWQ